MTAFSVENASNSLAAIGEDATKNLHNVPDSDETKEPNSPPLLLINHHDRTNLRSKSEPCLKLGNSLLKIKRQLFSRSSSVSLPHRQSIRRPSTQNQNLEKIEADTKDSRSNNTITVQTYKFHVDPKTSFRQSSNEELSRYHAQATINREMDRFQNKGFVVEQISSPRSLLSSPRVVSGRARETEVIPEPSLYGEVYPEVVKVSPL